MHDLYFMFLLHPTSQSTHVNSTSFKPLSSILHNSLSPDCSACLSSRLEKGESNLILSGLFFRYCTLFFLPEHPEIDLPAENLLHEETLPHSVLKYVVYLKAVRCERGVPLSLAGKHINIWLFELPTDRSACKRSEHDKPRLKLDLTVRPPSWVLHVGSQPQ